MTKRKAKSLSLKVWRYLAEHPELKSKRELPSALFKQLKQMSAWCPLCECFRLRNRFGCNECPLNYCLSPNASYCRWLSARTIKERKKAAEEVVKLIEAWEVK